MNLLQARKQNESEEKRSISFSICHSRWKLTQFIVPHFLPILFFYSFSFHHRHNQNALFFHLQIVWFKQMKQWKKNWIPNCFHESKCSPFRSKEDTVSLFSCLLQTIVFWLFLLSFLSLFFSKRCISEAVVTAKFEGGRNQKVSTANQCVRWTWLTTSGWKIQSQLGLLPCYQQKYHLWSHRWTRKWI